MKKPLLWITFAAILTIILSACGSGSAAVKSPTPPAPETAASTGAATSGATSAATSAAPTQFVTDAFPGIGETAIAPNTPTATMGANATAAPSNPTVSAASGQVYKLLNMLGGEIIPNSLLNAQGGASQNIHLNAFGAIDSILIDPQTGNIPYVLMSPGQPLSRQNIVLIAVPLNALKLAPNAEPSSSSKLDVFSTKFDKPVFQNAPGIRDVSTVNFSEPTFYVEFRKYWSNLGVSVQQVNQNGLLRLASASNIYVDTDMIDQQAHEIGNVAETLLNLNQDQVTFLVVSTGGVLGTGQNLTIVPWADISLAPFQGSGHFVLNANVEKLRGASSILNLDALDTLGPDWQQKYYNYWGVLRHPHPHSRAGSDVRSGCGPHNQPGPQCNPDVLNHANSGISPV